MHCLKIIFLSTSLLRNNIPVLGGPARLHLPTLAGPCWHCISTAKTVGAIANLFMTAQLFVFKQVFLMSPYSLQLTVVLSSVVILTLGNSPVHCTGTDYLVVQIIWNRRFGFNFRHVQGCVESYCAAATLSSATVPSGQYEKYNGISSQAICSVNANLATMVWAARNHDIHGADANARQQAITREVRRDLRSLYNTALRAK